MKSFDSRVYSIADYLEWWRNDQLILSPRFQRRSVWTETARSYLMDTIVRGKPIPKIFLRQQIDPGTGRSIREVVDGQQRLRTITSFLDDGLMVRKIHNPEWSGKYFSQLSDEQRSYVLNYELSTDLLIGVSDGEVLDIFSRLNSHAVVVNQQERINATHFGPFKLLADDLAHEHFEYWQRNRLLSDSQVMRMADVSLTSDLLIAMSEGIHSKKQVSMFYSRFETDFPHDTAVLGRQFQEVVSLIDATFPDGLRRTEFRRIHVYYSLFTAFFHLRFGLPKFDYQPPDGTLTPAQMRQALEVVEEIFNPDMESQLTVEQRLFLSDSRRATTDAQVRVRRTKYLLSQL